MESFQIDVIGWLGFILVSLGYYFNAKKKLYCFYVWGLGNAIYIYYGYIINAFPIIAMSLFVLFMNIYGYLNWINDISSKKFILTLSIDNDFNALPALASKPTGINLADTGL